MVRCDQILYFYFMSRNSSNKTSKKTNRKMKNKEIEGQKEICSLNNVNIISTGSDILRDVSYFVKYRKPLRFPSNILLIHES